MESFANHLILPVLAAVLIGVSEESLAQETGNDVVSAYQLGFRDGWERCRATPTCSNERAGDGTRGPGTYTQYVFPFAVFDGDVDETISVPNDWYITSGPSGEGVLGKIDEGGNFQPFVVEPGGELGLLPENQAPLWTANPAIKNVIDSLPKGPGGNVFVPVQPAKE